MPDLWHAVMVIIMKRLYLVASAGIVLVLAIAVGGFALGHYAATPLPGPVRIVVPAETALAGNVAGAVPASLAPSSVLPSVAPTSVPVVTVPPVLAIAADFAWSPESPRAGESIELIDRSSPTTSQRTWRWNRSVVSTGRTGSLRTTIQQDTAFTLVACDRDGRCAEVTKTVVLAR